MLLNPLRFETVGPDYSLSDTECKKEERLLFQIGTKRKVPPHLNKTKQEQRTADDRSDKVLPPID
jgi:hypothetical protein